MAARSSEGEGGEKERGKEERKKEDLRFLEQETHIYLNHQFYQGDLTIFIHGEDNC